MNLAELLGREAVRQTEFPVVRESVFLSHAAVCPLPARVAEALRAYADRAARGDQEAIIYPQILTATRQLGARLLGCQPEEVALVGPTSLGLSLVATGLRWQPGDNVLVYFDDYPSNVYPWLALAEKGVEVRRVQTGQLGVIHPDDVLRLVDHRTRLVALASCHFISGFRLDCDGLGRALRERGVLFCVDGIQTLGAFPTPVTHVDVLAADAHKWLLGPCGAGLLYVREPVQAQIHPPVLGWHNVVCPDYVAQEQIRYRAGAARFEAGTHNLLGIVGLQAALQLLLDVGVDNIAAELLRKRARLVSAMQARGWTVLNADAPPANASGIISICRPDRDMAALHRTLRQARILTSLRTDRSGRHYLRVSPHFYNTDAELDQLLEHL